MTRYLISCNFGVQNGWTPSKPNIKVLKNECNRCFLVKSTADLNSLTVCLSFKRDCITLKGVAEAWCGLKVFETVRSGKQPWTSNIATNFLTTRLCLSQFSRRQFVPLLLFLSSPVFWRKTPTLPGQPDRPTNCGMHVATRQSQRARFSPDVTV